eukprot:2292006-Rhodomonas_salina.1
MPQALEGMGRAARTEERARVWPQVQDTGMGMRPESTTRSRLLTPAAPPPRCQHSPALSSSQPAPMLPFTDLVHRLLSPHGTDLVLAASVLCGTERAYGATCCA